MALKEKDFIQIEYTATSDGKVFDTTDADVAKKNNILSDEAKYGPMGICLGKGYVLLGLDQKLIGKDLGRHTITLTPEEAFGKKDAGFVQMIPLNRFREHGFLPQVGLQINVDDRLGTVRAISGGRVIVDFNHPLAGHTVTYEVTIKKLITDAGEKVRAFLDFVGLRSVRSEVKDGVATLSAPKPIPAEVQKEFKKQLVEECGVKDVVFEHKEPAKDSHAHHDHGAHAHDHTEKKMTPKPPAPKGQ